MILSRLWNKIIFRLIFVAVAVPVFSMFIAMMRLPGIRSLELAAYDFHCRNLPSAKPDPRIVIVGMYDDTPEHVGEDAFPIARSKHASVVDVLHSAGAKVIAFDVWFTAPAAPEEDHAFAHALKQAGSVLCALKADFQEKNGQEEIGFTEPELMLRPYLRAGSIVVQRSFESRVRWYLPYPSDYSSHKRYLALPTAIAAEYRGDAKIVPTIRDRFRLGQIDAPLGSLGETLIRYAGGPETFKPIRYEDLYAGSWRSSHPADFFKGKIVIIGRVSGSEDNQDTPVGEMHGVEILANEVQTALNNTYPIHATEVQNLCVKLALCLLLALVVWRFGIWSGLVYTVGAMLLWTLAADRLFVARNIWLDTVEPVSVLFVSFVGMALMETRRLRRAFGRLMPESDAGLLLRKDVGAAGSTAEREVTIVFCDIRNYTALSETMPSRAVEELLHRFYTAGERTADRNTLDGDLDKFVGDEMMLRFESRRKKEHHAVRAVRWALAMQEFAKEVDSSGLTGEIGFRIGVGISTGPVRVGTVSAQKRIQSTVIGDAVNVASRLQNATKEVGRAIVIGPNTYEAVKDTIACEPLGEITVKGKQQPIDIYSLVM